jgi:hypothetical protein
LTVCLCSLVCEVVRLQAVSQKRQKISRRLCSLAGPSSNTHQPNSLLAHDFHEAFNVEEIPTATATATASVLCICPALVLPYDRNYALDKAAVPELITNWPNAAI